MRSTSFWIHYKDFVSKFLQNSLKMAESYNDWVKPSDVMKLRKYKNLKKSSSVAQIGSCSPLTTESPAKVSQTLEPVACGDTSLKRKNPFSCQQQNESKIQALIPTDCTSYTPDLTSSRLFRCVENLDKKETLGTSPGSYVDNLNQKNMEIESNKSIEAKAASNSGPTLPEDWSLRCKLRIFVPVSSVEKFWPIKGTDEARGIADFVNKNENKDVKQVLQSLLMYWSYPNLPWINLFPRMDPGKQKIELHDHQMLNKSAEHFVFNEWLDAMSSCYQNIKQDLSPYMYVCCQHMTILFISALASGRGEMVAMVTPTTRGLRKSLDDEGIDYQLPLVIKRDRELNTNSEKEKNSMGEREKDGGSVKTHSKRDDDADDDDEDDESWLEKLGLDKKQYRGKEFRMIPKNDNNHLEDDFRLIDYRPASTVLITGMNSNAFFNFFVNSGHVISTVGPLSGIPPTILSPSAFKNSSLRSLMVYNKGELVGNIDHLISVKNSDDKRLLLELVGPILPSNFKNICHFFARNCEAFSGIFNVLESSVPFNSFESNSKHIIKVDHENEDSQIIKLRNSALRSIEFSESLFKWNEKK